MPDPPTQRHLVPNPTALGTAAEKAQRRPAPATEAMVVPPPCRALWLSKRKVEMPLKRRVAGLRESAICTKT